MKLSNGLPPTFCDGFNDLEEVKRLKYNQMGNTDLVVPLIAFGGAHMSSGVVFEEEKTPISGHENAVNTLREAIKIGINYVDVAPLYGAGKSEIVTGKALEGVPREAFYIASKVGRKHNCEFDYSAEAVFETFEESLRRLKLSYLDVVHVHDVEFADFGTLISETLPALDKLRSEKKLNYVAINGYPLDLLMKVVEASPVHIDIVQTYCRCTLFDNSLFEVLPFFKERNLGVINAASYGMGLLTKGKVPDWHPAKPETIAACQEATAFCNARDVDISRLAIDHAFTAIGIDTTLVGLNNMDLLKENLNILNNGLSKKERSVADEVKKQFETLTVRNWENVELTMFRENKREFEKKLKQLLQ